MASHQQNVSNFLFANSSSKPDGIAAADDDDADIHFLFLLAFNGQEAGEAGDADAGGQIDDAADEDAGAGNAENVALFFRERIFFGFARQAANDFGFREISICNHT